MRCSGDNTAEAVRVRALMEASEPSSGAFAAMNRHLDDTIATVGQIAGQYGSERVVAIKARLERELDALRQQAAERAKANAQALFQQIEQVDAASFGTVDAYASHIAQMQRAAAAEQARAEEELAAQMGRLIDAAGIELSSASVADDWLAPLRQIRSRAAEDFRRVVDVRRWFAH